MGVGRWMNSRRGPGRRTFRVFLRAGSGTWSARDWMPCGRVDIDLKGVFGLTDDQSRIPPRTPGNGHARGGRTKLERAVILDPEQSAALREKLLIEVGNITSADLATAWARATLTAK